MPDSAASIARDLVAEIVHAGALADLWAELRVARTWGERGRVLQLIAAVLLA